mgnify:CR=1 FL=1
MKDFEIIGKQMPFAESEEYVKQLVEHTANQAIRHRPKAKTVSLHVKLAAAVMLILLATASLVYYNKFTEPEQLTAEQVQDPLDQFLNGLTDDEVQLLAYYDIDEIPEYEYEYEH